MLGVTHGVRLVIGRVGRGGAPSSPSSAARAHVQRVAIFRPLSDERDDGAERAELAIITLLGDYRRFV
jgi:hypothetical protein